MTVGIGQREQIAYVPSAGQFRNAATGRFIRRTEVLKFVEAEIYRTKIQLQGHTRLLISDTINMAEWQVRMATSLRESHIRMAALGSGGAQNLTSRTYGAVGYRLREQYDYLSKFSLELAEGTLTPNQALTRAGLYANSVKPTFHRAEQIQKETEGFRSAKRSLDAAAQHCPSCLNYSTQGQYRAIASVVLPGVACVCRQFCRCTIEYSKLPPR
jgi:hypothetical protein